MSSSPDSAFSRVDLPDPLRPTRHSRSPFATGRSTPANSGRPPKPSCAPRSATTGGATLSLGDAMNSNQVADLLDAVPGAVDARKLVGGRRPGLLGGCLGDQPVGEGSAHTTGVRG